MKIAPFNRSHLAKIAMEMKTRPYGRDVKSGYSLTTVRVDYIEGTFTERLEYVEKVQDPLGGELAISRIEFRRTDFRISIAYPQVEFRNPARQVRSIINLIGNCLDFQVAITGIEPSPLDWANAIGKLGEQVQVLRLRSALFSLSSEAQAYVLINGTTDVRRLLPALLGNRRIDADTVLCSWGGEANRWLLELRATGCAVVFEAPVDHPSEVIRKAIAALI